jgi:hypothetical protein
MEEIKRKPFEGVINIVKFNRHFYIVALAVIFIILGFQHFYPGDSKLYIVFLALFIFEILVSLLVSHYIYDRSDLYTLNWLNGIEIPSNAKLVNINAGFDETSTLIKRKYPDADLEVFDFYDPVLHTEISIERARKAYPVFPGTKAIQTSAIPLKANSCDCIFLILAAHEIRNPNEQLLFFSQLRDALKATGKIVVTEHSRDLPNFMAYNFGFLHFFSKRNWLRIFDKAGLKKDQIIKITPFITTYILSR